MFPTTLELFEFNKMWFVFGISLLILFLWFSKVILSGKVVIKRTPLDIPILLFLLSQFISTIFSLDPHVSWWGYYSRFNGGFLSTLTYVFLYYSFASNVIYEKSDQNGSPTVFRFLLISLISGAFVALWGLPSHFGKDPTCLVFRGSFDVSCWTEAFQPTVRMFSTLGQPNWFAAYLSILLLVSLACAIEHFIPKEKGKGVYQVFSNTHTGKEKMIIIAILCLLLTTVFYLDLTWTNSQSGFASFWAGLFVFIALSGVYFLRTSSPSKVLTNTFIHVLLGVTVLLFVINMFVGFPIGQLRQYTFTTLFNRLTSPASTAQPLMKNAEVKPVGPALEVGGTDSGKIRKIVWSGALQIFKAHPLIGTGVETFAYAYYQVKPATHNLTSEWDFLYNKAHNEYLNYLATTGAFGLGTYLFIIVLFLFSAGTVLFKKKLDSHFFILALSLVGSYVTILISNFFGFSVVIVNIFFFFIPLFFYDLAAPQLLRNKVFVFWKQSEKSSSYSVKHAQHGSAEDTTYVPHIIGIVLAGLIIVYLEFLLFRFWIADQKYALGYNLNKVGRYVQAATYLDQAVKLRPGEYLFKDEYSVNLSTLALLFKQQKNDAEASSFAEQAKTLSDEVIEHHPNNVLYYKSRTRVMYALAQINENFMSDALSAIKRAHQLAPTDAKIVYNMALIYDQAGKKEEAESLMKQAISLKPNYRDAYYGLGLLYAQHAKAEKEAAKAAALKKAAKEVLTYSLEHITPKDTQIEELLKTLAK